MTNIHRDPAEDRPEPEDCLEKEVLVIGCGNVMIGDDGLGPAFIKHLSERGGLPAHVGILDAGTGVRAVLFGMVLAEKKPRRLIVVDAVDMGRSPGEVFEIDLAEVPALKADDFSMHQLPTSNMLRELRDQCGVDVRVVAVQVSELPTELKGGLSAPVAASMDRVAAIVERYY
ncbi:MAG: hydrogenase maturation protease [Elusimicrobia bacterium]|nr:hydrogenase maturation protease [Elusimicrobiota bacterium]